MKIGMILDQEFPPDPRVQNEAISLIKAGHEVFLFCLHYGNQKQKENIEKIHVRRYFSTNLEYKLSALAYTFPFYKLLMFSKIKHFILENNIEILHIHDIRIAGAVFKANKKFKLKVVLDLHENRPEIMKYYPHLSKFPGNVLISPKMWKLQEEIFIKKANKVIVVTNESKKEILSRVSIPDDTIAIITNTVRRAFYEDVYISDEIVQKYSNKFVLLYIGDTGLRRGLVTAIKALKTVKEEISNIKLIIVGRNSSDGVLKELVHRLDLEAYVDFEGWQEPKLFQSYITASAICLSPLHRNLHHDTTYANKIFQYMSLRKPLLVSDAVAQKVLVEKVHAGIVHKEKDVDDFSKKVIHLYKDKTLRDTLGSNGESFIKKEFSWEETSKTLINLYNNVQS
jgi:glycosyltransferase involved in cell wall biosynthesis